MERLPHPAPGDPGYPQSIDFAVGGATATGIGSAAVPPFWHLTEQVDAYLASGNLIGPNDLVTLNIGGNDGLRRLGIMTEATAPTFANTTADAAFAQIQRLVDSGAQNFVIGGFTGLSNLGVVPDAVADVADAFGQAYFDAMQTRLASISSPSARFFMLDLFALGEQVARDPSRYGLVGINCPVVGGPTGGDVCGGVINSPLQNQFFLGPDGLHLTNRGFEIVAQYMANIVLAPDTIAVQPEVVQSAASGFTGSVLSRLDANREQVIASALVAGEPAPMYLGRGEDARKRGPAPVQAADASSRLTAYSMGTIVGGQRSGSSILPGFDYDAGAGTVGLEYRVSRNLVAGLAGNYTDLSADLDSRANISNGAIQVAAYLSYSSRHWFGDVLLSYGHHDIDLTRPGVIDHDYVRSSTDASSFAAAAKGGYLLDLGKLRAGPIAGLTYVRSEVDAYTEQGDDLLTFDVDKQTVSSLVGSAGVQIRAPFVAGGHIISPYLNVTVEHQFGDDARTLTATLTQAPLLPILTTVPNFDERTYGKVEGGVTLGLGPNVSATLTAASTFARGDDNDFLVSGGFNYRF